MTPYEKIIKIIREQGAKKNTPALNLGEMISQNQCQVGGNVLEAEDLYISEHLTNGYKVDITLDAVTSYMNNKETTTKVWMEKQRATVHNPLKAGDIVLLYPVSEEKYVIIEKVVSLDVSV